MVNAIVHDLSFSRNPEGTELVAGYLRELHFVHGFETVFIPDTLYAVINAQKNSKEKYLGKLGHLNRNENNTMRECEKKLESILWKMKRTDIDEAHLRSFLSLLSVWLQAIRLKSLVVEPLSSPVNNFSTLTNLLVGDQRDYIGKLADDLELWLFSHFADLYSEWPYFLDFSVRTAESLQEDEGYAKFHSLFMDLRTKSQTYSTHENSLKKREKTLSRMLAYCNFILALAKQKCGKEVIITKSSLAVSNKTLSATGKRNWNYADIARLLWPDNSDSPNFVPCFTHIRLYPLELLKSISPYALLPRNANPLVYYSSFEIGEEAQLRLALGTFRKRLKITGIS